VSDRYSPARTATPIAPEPNPAVVRRWKRIILRSLAACVVLLAFASFGLYLGARGPVGALNAFLFDLKARRDAQAWTRLCAADQREVSQQEFIAAWRVRRADYEAVIDEVDAFTFEPFGNVRHLHYRLTFRNDGVQPHTYAVTVLREAGTWKVCGFFSHSRNPAKPGILSGFDNW
jgi:hypothetical protein